MADPFVDLNANLRTTKTVEAAWLAQIESVETCDDLLVLAERMSPWLQKQTNDLQHQIAKYTTLTVAPTTLIGVIAWIAAQVELYAIPLANAIEQAEQIAQLSIALSAAIANKSNGLQCQVSVPLPTVVVET